MRVADQQFGQAECDGDGMERESCEVPDCSNDCTWGPWSGWSGCSASCGGRQMSIRMLKDVPVGGGGSCAGEGVRWRECATGLCSEHPCAYANWGEWSACTKTCGWDGSRMRVRGYMVHPTDGKECPGPSYEFGPCPSTSCIKDSCLWGDWNAWSTCSREVGKGIQTSRRIIKHIAEDGIVCKGDVQKLQSCTVREVPDEGPIDCEWGAWSPWTSCSKSCAGGKQQSFRTFHRTPDRGGKSCAGTFMKEQDCQQHSCPGDWRPGPETIDCQWSDWTEATPCSVTCGIGTKMVYRWIAVHAQFGGKECEGGVITKTATCADLARCVVADVNATNSSSMGDAALSMTRAMLLSGPLSLIKRTGVYHYRWPFVFFVLGLAALSLLLYELYPHRKAVGLKLRSLVATVWTQLILLRAWLRSRLSRMQGSHPDDEHSNDE